MFAPALIERAAALLTLCRDRGLKLATAESCTGGLVAGLLTEIPGSSAVVERGFVVYSNLAKQEMLGVPEATLARWGAVSAATARAMARGRPRPFGRRPRRRHHRRRRPRRRHGGEAGRPRPFRRGAPRRRAERRWSGASVRCRAARSGSPRSRRRWRCSKRRRVRPARDRRFRPPAPRRRRRTCGRRRRTSSPSRRRAAGCGTRRR